MSYTKQKKDITVKNTTKKEEPVMKPLGDLGKYENKTYPRNEWSAY
jgi:hypothetical protein